MGVGRSSLVQGSSAVLGPQDQVREKEGWGGVRAVGTRYSSGAGVLCGRCWWVEGRLNDHRRLMGGH